MTMTTVETVETVGEYRPEVGFLSADELRAEFWLKAIARHTRAGRASVARGLWSAIREDILPAARGE